MRSDSEYRMRSDSESRDKPDVIGTGDLDKASVQVFILEEVARNYAFFPEIADLLHQAAELIEKLPENQSE